MRASILQKKKDETMKKYLLVSTPIDPEFEMLVIACSINLLESLLKARFKTSVQEDQNIL
jgi:hypothetical protein